MGIAEQASPLNIAGALVLLVGLAVVARKVWQYVRAIAVGLRKIGHVVDDVLGEKGRNGEPDRPGWGERLAAIEGRTASTDERLVAVEHELHPNSGSSLRDAVDRASRQITDLDTRMQESNTKRLTYLKQVREAGFELPPVPGEEAP